jgi:nocardicin N-oxygenase
MRESASTVYPYAFDEPVRLEPDPLYARLREEEPLARVRSPYGRESWLVTRWEAARTVLADPLFSRAAAIGPDAPRSTPMWPKADAMVALDPPDHTRLRRLVAPAFTTRRIDRLRARAERLLDSMLDEMVRQGPPADLVAKVAFPLPIALICEMLGVPYADRHRFGRWSHTLLSRTAYSPDEVDRADTDLRAYLAGLVARRRGKPATDMLGVLVRARDERGRLSEDELLSLALTLLVTGHETTSSQIANFVYVLLTHPDQLAWLRADPARVPGAVEELLRYVPLATGAPGPGGHARIATADTELDGVTVHCGDALLPAIQSANRDPSIFPHADELDLSRSKNPHLTFGHGPHHCLGAPLARMELTTALTGLLRRFPALRLAVPADEVPWQKGLTVRRPRALPVAW